MTDRTNTVVLAFSGGLDTSFCVPWLAERGYDVVTLFVNTGGVSAAQQQEIAGRAHELGAARHIEADASGELWDSFVVPFVRAGVAYQDQYPLLCSDRGVIARKMAETADELGTPFVAHGCTAAGNDQFRFDQTLRCLGNYTILAPIRELQSETRELRAYEEKYLRDRGFEVNAKARRYTINENLLGATISGSEIDRWEEPSDEARLLTAPPDDWPREPLSVTIGFERGEAVSLDGRTIAGPELLAQLNRLFSAYGVGRGLYTGDTTIGLKGRIVYECPGLTALRTAHRALEEAVLTKHQNAFKPQAGRAWTQLIYEGFFYEPLRQDLEALITSTQRAVTGRVTVKTHGGSCAAVAIDSPNILQRRGATYAQGADWTGTHAEGFIALYGQSSVLARARDLAASRAEAKQQTSAGAAC